MANKNNKKGPQLTLNFAKLKQAYCFALMLLKEVSTFQRLTGCSSLIHQMILMITSTVLAEPVAAKRVEAKP